MKDLQGRAFALDPQTGAAVQVIAYFDALAESRAGLEATVRGVAALTECPARLVAPDGLVRIRVHPDGRREDAAGHDADPVWPRALVGGCQAVLAIERDGAAHPTDALVLERAAGVLRDVVDRVWGVAPEQHPDDSAVVEVLVDRRVSPRIRLRAARTLGLDTQTRARVLATTSGPHIQPVGRDAMRQDAAPPDRGPQRLGTDECRERTGVGPYVPVVDLPDSWDLARIALRLAAEGTEHDPGPRIVRADDLGGLVTLVQGFRPGSAPLPDVQALDKAAARAPGILAALHATAYATSIRAAAECLTVHHSTLQERINQAVPLLGWDIRTPRGRLRLQLALHLRHLHHTEMP